MNSKQRRKSKRFIDKSGIPYINFLKHKYSAIVFYCTNYAVWNFSKVIKGNKF